MGVSCSLVPVNFDPSFKTEETYLKMTKCGLFKLRVNKISNVYIYLARLLDLWRVEATAASCS